MPLRPPDLDSRTFDDLVREARDRIPRFTPDWTNLNDSDPGMTLVKLQAWLAKTVLYQLNRVPELNYVKFLELLNVEPVPARAARAELTFRLKKLKAPGDPLVVIIPKGTQVAVDDPDVTDDVVFETDHSLRAYNATVAALIASTGDAARPLRLVTRYDVDAASATVLHAFHPFGTDPVAGRTFHVGLLLRPHVTNDRGELQDTFPDGQLDVMISAAEVFDADEAGALIEGPATERARLAYEVEAGGRRVEWEVYVGTDHLADFGDASGDQATWRRLSLSADQTAGLLRSGHVRLEIPEGISAAALGDFRRSVWSDLGLKKPPVTFEELIADLEDPDLPLTADMLTAADWETIGVRDAAATGFLSCCDSVSEFVAELERLHGAAPLRPSALPAAAWPDDAGYDTSSVPPFSLAWLRARLVDATSYSGRLLNEVLLNTVPATAAVTRLEETLGTSDGRPAQQFTLGRTPIYTDAAAGTADLELDVLEGGEVRRWTAVPDFFRQGSEAEVYLLDATTGTIHFGDGRHGRIPVAGATVVARRYRFGGGRTGNAGRGTITKLRSALPRVESATNRRSASGGADAEALEDVKLRAPHDLRTRDRAVTADDFAHLALGTPGVSLHRAYAVPRTRLNEVGEFETADGAVTVVALPRNAGQETPQPSEAQLRAVANHLNARRLITTELWVTGPSYTRIEELEATLRVADDADLKEVEDAAYDALLAFFHPLHGGDDGRGWPFGGDIYFGNVYDRLLSLPGVRRVINLSIRLAAGDPGSYAIDALPIGEGHLVHLARSSIDLNVAHGVDT
jgi:hypothetical protein